MRRFRQSVVSRGMVERSREMIGEKTRLVGKFASSDFVAVTAKLVSVVMLVLVVMVVRGGGAGRKGLGWAEN